MAEYTVLDDAECSRLMTAYGFEMTSWSTLKGGMANSSFHVRCSEGVDVVLTVLDNHTFQSASQLVVLTDWLIESGIQTPHILPQLDGMRIETHGSLPVIVRPFILGRQPARLTPSQTESVGTALGVLHQLTPPSMVALPRRRLPPGWREEIVGGAPIELLDSLDGAAHLLDGLEPFSPALIHGDLFPDNMMWSSDDTLHLLDWETASIDWAPLDLGFTAVGIAGDDNVLSDSMRQTLVEAYCAVTGAAMARTDFDIAAHYACAVLMFHRYRRHVLRHRDPARVDHWRRLLPFMETTTPSR